MEEIFNFLIVFLVINSIFWGLFSHNSHCNLAKLLGIPNNLCPPHWSHILFALICFIIAIILSQRKYILALNIIK